MEGCEAAFPAHPLAAASCKLQIRKENKTPKNNKSFPLPPGNSMPGLQPALHAAMQQQHGEVTPLQPLRTPLQIHRAPLRGQEGYPERAPSRAEGQI